MTDLAAEHWGKVAREGAVPAWTDSPRVKSYINRLISGDPTVGWLKHTIRTYFQNGVERGLSLGCGSGAVERHLRRREVCRFVDAIDIAPGAIEEAKVLAAREGFGGIDYRVGDLNVIDLPADRYDVVFASSSLHHVEKLERLFDQITRSLKPNGLLVMIEYVGPSRLQFTAKAVQIMNQLLAMLPREFRFLASKPGDVKERIVVTPVENLIAVDPSESIRSAEILPILHQHFAIIERKDFGGTINHMLLQDIVQNFDNPQGDVLIDMVMGIESLLIKEKVIESDFCFVVASPLRHKGAKS